MKSSCLKQQIYDDIKKGIQYMTVCKFESDGEICNCDGKILIRNATETIVVLSCDEFDEQNLHLFGQVCITSKHKSFNISSLHFITWIFLF